MQRNLLLILDKIGKWPADFSLASYARHADARVRREAVRMMLANPEGRDSALRSTLVDSDQQVVQMALGAAIENLPAACRAAYRKARDGASMGAKDSRSRDPRSGGNQVSRYAGHIVTHRDDKTKAVWTRAAQ